ncbi:MAG: membrane protein insertase YidC [Gemmatimonadaceae bacterium]
MDKRTILALALVAIVIIVTPKLFPTAVPTTPAKAVPGAPVATDSIPASAPIESAATPLPAPATVAAPATRPASDSLGAVATAGRVDSTVVADSMAEFLFTNMGAAPLRVRLPKFRALNSSHGTEDVRITPGDQPLLGYRLIGTADTTQLATVPFELTRSESATGTPVLTYRARVQGRSVQIEYTVVPDSFLAHVTGSVTADSGGAAARFLLIDLPTTFRSFEADSMDDQNHFAYAIKPKVRGAEGIPFGKMDPGERKLVTGPLEWAAAKSKYFMVGVLAPVGDESFAEAYTIGGARTARHATLASGTVVNRLENGTFAFDLYAGPQTYKRLQSMGRDFENSNPYGGWMQGVVQPFATMVMKVLLWMRATLKLDYGWLLVIFGVAVRLILWPLNHAAMRTSMKMQRIQPELNEIQKKYKQDPQKLQSEMMRVYKEHDMSPFSTFAGCLPMLLPMPVLFALFFVFQNTIEFRGVPFLWLADISLKDPYYIVPLLMGVSMFVLSWIGMRNSPPNPQAKMMLYIFPVMMTFLFANFASGLNLYYAIQNIAALPQQWLIANERAKGNKVAAGSKLATKKT